jgi:hypothetical protein
MYEYDQKASEMLSAHSAIKAVAKGTVGAFRAFQPVQSTRQPQQRDVATLGDTQQTRLRAVT